MEKDIRINSYSDINSINEVEGIKIEENNKEKENIQTEEPILNNENINITIEPNIQEKRVITQEIIDIINSDKYKKYKGKNENTLSKLKIENIENFSEKKILLDSSDILKIKSIYFENISTGDFNDLLTENSYISKKFKTFNKAEELENKTKEGDKQNNESIEQEDKIDLEQIKFKNCDINLDFGNTFPIIKVLKIINCQLPFNLHNKLNFNNLTHLILENVGLITENFEYLFFQMRANTNLRKNLKVISFKNNNIGMLDLCKGVPYNLIVSKAEFTNLEVMDFSNNKIFCISINIKYILKNIKIIDLTNNNIAFPFGYNFLIEYANKNKVLLLITKNLGLIKNNSRDEYIKFLFDIIPNIDYPVKKLPLINLYVGSYYNRMKELNLSKFNNSLIELELSFGNINNTDLIYLLKNNLALYNLKKLNLTKNKLTEALFDLLLKDNFQNQFLKLKELNLSENPISFQKAKNYQDFFENFKSIQILILKITNFEASINNYMKNKINRYYENEKFKQYKTNFTEENLEMQKIIDNNHYLNEKTNITINIYDNNSNKYVSQIRKIYPEILERIDIETKFFDIKTK